MLRTVVAAALLVVLGTPLGAQERPSLQAHRVTIAPKIDGVLDDEAWRESPLDLGTWISYNPARGDTGPERTEVRVAYDDRYIYFAFHCISEDPSSIRTTF